VVVLFQVLVVGGGSSNTAGRSFLPIWTGLTPMVAAIADLWSSTPKIQRRSNRCRTDQIVPVLHRRFTVLRHSKSR
jgi:hypothetical protein